MGFADIVGLLHLVSPKRTGTSLHTSNNSQHLTKKANLSTRLLRREPLAQLAATLFESLNVREHIDLIQFGHHLGTSSPGPGTTPSQLGCAE